MLPVVGKVLVCVRKLISNIALKLFLLFYFSRLICTLLVIKQLKFYTTYIIDAGNEITKRRVSKGYFERVMINVLVDIEGGVGI